MADKDFVVKNGLIVNTNLIVANGDTNRVGINNSNPDASLTVTGTANVSGNVTLTGTTLTVAANATFNGNLVVNSNTYFNERIYIGNNQQFVPLLRPVLQAVDKFNGFVQLSSQNLANATSGAENGGTDACSDLVVFADNTDEFGYSSFLDMGMNNSNFNGTFEYLTVSSAAAAFAIGSTVYQRDNTGANVATGILKAKTANGSNYDLIVSISKGYDEILPTDSTYKDITDGVTNASVVSMNHRNYAFTIGKGNDGYLYIANGALTIGTTEGGRRANTFSISSVTFASGNVNANTTSTANLKMGQWITGTGIPANTQILTVTNSTSFVMSKTPTGSSSGVYQIYDELYDTSGNPIVFHTQGMYAESEVGRWVGNGNFVIGPNTTSRADKLNVAGTANITGNVALADNLTVAGNVTVTGNVSSPVFRSGANVVVNTSTMFAGNSTVNATQTSSLLQIANSTSIANLTAADLKIGTTVLNSSLLNVTLVTGNIAGTYANISGQVNTATLYAATSANIASTVQANNSGIFSTAVANAQNFTAGAGYGAASVGTTVNSGIIGISSNATVNTQITSSSLRISNSSTSANLTATDLKIGTTTINANIVSTGANVTLNTSAAFIGNSVANAIITSTLLQVSNSTNIANITPAELRLGTTVVNTSIISVGLPGAVANAIAANSTAIVFGNSSVNATINATFYSATSNNTSFVGSTSSANVVSNAQLQSNLANYQTTAGLAANVAKLTANDSAYFANQLPAYYTNASNMNTGTLPSGRISGNYTGINNVGTLGVLTVAGNTSFTNANFVMTSNATHNVATFGPANINFDSNTLFIDAVNNRVGIGVNNPDAELKVLGNANVSGNLSVGSNFTVGGTFTTTGVTEAQGNIVPLSNGYSLGNTISRWNLIGLDATLSANVAAQNAVIANLISVGSNVNINLDNISIGNNSVYFTSNSSALHITGSILATTINAVSAMNIGSNVGITTSTLSIGNTTANTIANSIFIRVANATNSANITPADIKIGTTVLGATSTQTNSISTNTVTSNVINIGSNVSVTTAALLLGNSTVNSTVNSITVAFTNSTATATLNATAYSGTANNATNLNGQPASYYTNASTLDSGTVSSARLPQGNATTIGAVQVLDSVTNTSILITAAANSVKNAYDRAIDANTRAASAQTAANNAYTNAIAWSGNAALAFSNAVSTAATDATTKANNAYTTAISYTDGRIIDSISNTSNLYAAAANSVKNAYDRAIDANTRAASAQTAANNAYTNAIAWSGNAALAYANAIAWSGNAALAYANAIAWSGNAALAYANAVANSAADATTKANNAYTTAIAWSGNAALAYANAIAWSGNSALAFSNAVSTAASDATTKANNAYTTAIAWSGNAALAYANAIAWSGNAALAYANAVSNAQSYTLSRIIDKVDNTFITFAASANTAKTIYTAAIDANTRAASAQSAAIFAYSNAVSDALTDTLARIIDSVTNTSITYAAAANSVKNAYDRAIDANTRAASAQSAAISAYNNASTLVTSSNYTRTGVTTQSANIIFNSGISSILIMNTSPISANGTLGTAGQVLHSNGSATYWDNDDQGVTQIVAGTGLSGGTITGTGTLSVNATYIGTIAPTLTGTGASGNWNINVIGWANNLQGGTAGTIGRIPYQNGASVTEFTTAGSSGQLLTSAGGAAAPTWTTVGNVITRNVTITTSGTPTGGAAGDLWFQY